MIGAGVEIREIVSGGAGHVPGEVLTADEPVILRGLVANWPLAQAARQSADAAEQYLRRFESDVPVTVSIGPPEIGGRIFYNEDMTGLNFEAHRLPFNIVLDKLRDVREHEKPPVLYVGSTSVDYCLPGLRRDNDLELPVPKPLISAWIGNQTRIAAHFDIPDNIACVAVGKRRFTLFPPDQLPNLYIGPLDFAPAGQAISLVDFQDPDLVRYPRFKEAMEQARVANMEPGDAIFIPSMWWHHIEGLDSFNMLVNYWWRSTPDFMGTPLDALKHAILSLRDLPAAQRSAWRDMFEHYVFAADEDVVAHIPEQSRGMLAPMDDLSARKLRAQLLKRLNR